MEIELTIRMPRRDSRGTEIDDVAEHGGNGWVMWPPDFACTWDLSLAIGVPLAVGARDAP